MTVYDDLGNMVNEPAAVVARGMSQQVAELFDTLFAEGMTIVEAYALIDHLQSEISTVARMNVLLHLTKVVDGNKAVSVKVHGKYPACLDKTCSHRRKCANHTTAGDYRTVDGLTPDLIETDTEWQCNRCAEQTGGGAILVDGTYVGEHDECCQ